MGCDPKIGKYGLIAINSVVAIFGLVILGFTIGFYLNDHFKNMVLSGIQFVDEFGPDFISQLAAVAKQTLFLEILMPVGAAITLFGLIGCCAGIHENKFVVVIHVLITAIFAISTVVFAFWFRTNENILLELFQTWFNKLRNDIIYDGVETTSGKQACEFFMKLMMSDDLPCCGAVEADITNEGICETPHKCDFAHSCELLCLVNGKKTAAGAMTCPQAFNRNFFTKRDAISTALFILFVIELFNLGFAISAARSAFAKRRRHRRAAVTSRRHRERDSVSMSSEESYHERYYSDEKASSGHHQYVSKAREGHHHAARKTSEGHHHGHKRASGYRKRHHSDNMSTHQQRQSTVRKHERY